MGGFQSVPAVIKNLIIANVLVYIAELTFKEPFVNLFSLHYYASPDFRIWQVFTHMFLHAMPPTFFHIIFNMLALYMFGSPLETLWGGKRFLLFYLICGLGAGVIQMLSNGVEMHFLVQKLTNGSITQQDYQLKGGLIYNGIALGASGAIMGVLAGFAYLFPNTSLFILPIPFPIKTKYAIAGLILLDVFGGIYPEYGGDVAHFAHLGGALFGFLLVKTMNKKNRRNFY
ncbi:MAG: rhomboid family intramembrane serine protease [Chitinophagaceae bacterium]|nr:rhomboid family intramembrane serine protease [Chitinophagaceae bacterium]